MDDIETESPEFIADLLGEVLGERLTTFRTCQHDCNLRISLGKPTGATQAGLFVDAARQYGVHHHGMSWEIYSGGRPRFGHAWDDNEDDVFGEALPFEDWVRGEVVSIVDARAHREVRELWDALALEPAPVGTSAESRTDALLELAARYAGDERYWHAAAQAIRALLDMRRLGADAPHAFETLARVLPQLHGRLDEARSDWGAFLRKGAHLLRGKWAHELPEAALVRIDDEVEALLSALEAGLPAHRFLRRCRDIASCAPVIRAAFSRAFCEQCERPEHLHMVASEYRAHPEEVLPILEAAMRLAPEDRTILAALQGAHATVGQQDEADAVAERLEEHIDAEADPSQLGDDVQSWIDAYNLLANEFSACTPRPCGDPEQRGRNLIELQNKLNRYWRETFPHRLDECVAQGRFLSSGSAGYVGWLRNQGRYQEAVDHVCEQLADEELSALRHRAHAWAFENFLNNGFGSFVDSGEPQHVTLALQLLTRVESFLELGATSDVLYQAACVCARAGESRRAIDYAQRAVAQGESIRVMWNDSDLVSLRREPEFQRLLG